MLSIIVAVDENRGIGNQNGLPWKLPADLKHFKEVTMGHPIIMGRKTFESIGRALPGRRNIIVTRNADFSASGCEIVHALDEALKLVGSEDAFVIGGAEIFRQAFPVVQRMYMTEIRRAFSCDVFFPEFNMNEWREVERKQGVKDEKNPYEYYFVVYERKR